MQSPQTMGMKQLKPNWSNFSTSSRWFPSIPTHYCFFSLQNENITQEYGLKLNKISEARCLGNQREKCLRQKNGRPHSVKQLLYSDWMGFNLMNRCSRLHEWTQCHRRRKNLDTTRLNPLIGKPVENFHKNIYLREKTGTINPWLIPALLKSNSYVNGKL